MKNLIVPDLAAIGAGAVERLATAYDALAEQTLMPLPEMDGDPVRGALDEAVCEALCLDAERVTTIRRHRAVGDRAAVRRVAAGPSEGML